MAKNPTYNVKDLDKRVNAVAAETGGEGVAGLYRHPETGNEAITTWDPLFGDVQSNAFERLGFERVGDAPEGSVHSIELDAVVAGASETDSNKGLSARLAVLEGALARNTELEDRLEEYRKKYEGGAATDSPAVQVAVQATKEDAAEQVALRGQGDATEEIREEAPEVTDFQEDEVNDDVASEAKTKTAKTNKK